jgi:ABC-type polysaccharide/polyol phosphate transport system ATPase subunit
MSEEIFEQAFVNGRTIIHVSHNMSTIKKYANKVILLHEGDCRGIGSPDEILALYKRTIKVDRFNTREDEDHDQR